jgi:hypothetical protein
VKERFKGQYGLFCWRLGEFVYSGQLMGLFLRLKDEFGDIGYFGRVVEERVRSGIGRTVCRWFVVVVLRFSGVVELDMRDSFEGVIGMPEAVFVLRKRIKGSSVSRVVRLWCDFVEDGSAGSWVYGSRVDILLGVSGLNGGWYGKYGIGDIAVDGSGMISSSEDECVSDSSCTIF